MKIKQLNQFAIVPTKGSEYSAGYDLYYAADPSNELVLYPHTTTMIPTGWAMEIPQGCFGGIFARSGLASTKGLRPANCVGVIDSDYRGEVKVALHNDLSQTVTIKGGERIAQLIIMEYNYINFEIVDELNDTNRGQGGFGSTGK